jgi:hypothetical protein
MEISDKITVRKRAAMDTENCDMLRVTDHEPSAKEVYYELLRDLLQDKTQKIEEYAEYVPSEIVYKALIISEFMASRNISDIRQGVRLFTAFERERLKRLHLV